MTVFLKTYPDASVAETAIARTNSLVEQGVPTARILRREGACQIAFERLEGHTGQALRAGGIADLLSCALAGLRICCPA